MVLQQVKAGKHSGPFFTKKSGKKASIRDYNLAFGGLPYVAVRVEGSLVISRGGHQGLQLPPIPASLLGSARHEQAVPQAAIDDTNRWCRKDAARGAEGRLPF